MAAEIERARRIQSDLLPSAPPQVAGLEIAQRIEFLGEMGGDYFDFVPYADGRLGIVCGDVMGKGLAAALIMAMARSVVHDAASSGGEPSQVLSRVNDSLARDLEGQKLPYFLTAAYLLYDPATGGLTLAGAGHNPVFVLSADGVQRLDSRGAILGVRPWPGVPRRPRAGRSRRRPRLLHRRSDRGEAARRRAVRQRPPVRAAQRAQGRSVGYDGGRHLGGDRRLPWRRAAERRRHARAGSPHPIGSRAGRRGGRLRGIMSETKQPATLRVFRYESAGSTLRSIIGDAVMPLAREELVKLARDAVAQRTFVVHAVPGSGQADELCFIPSESGCEILSIHSNGWRRHYGDHRRSLMQILNDLAAAVACSRLRLLDDDELRLELDRAAPALTYTISDSATLADARTRLGDALELVGIEGARREETVLCASEAATNALVHGGGGGTVSLVTLERPRARRGLRPRLRVSTSSTGSRRRRPNVRRLPWDMVTRSSWTTSIACACIPARRERP